MGVSIVHTNILFCWVSGDADIHGNTKADTTARATLDKDVTLMNLPYTDFKHGINMYVRQLWQLTWDVQVDNKLYSLRTRVGTNVLHCVSRRDEVVLPPLRIGHTFFNSPFLLLKSEPRPQCIHTMPVSIVLEALTLTVCRHGTGQISL